MCDHFQYEIYGRERLGDLVTCNDVRETHWGWEQPGNKATTNTTIKSYKAAQEYCSVNSYYYTKPPEMYL